MSASQLPLTFLQAVSQIHLYHWQTGSYARHVAAGALYTFLDGKADEFIEVYQGKYGRIRLGRASSLPLKNLTDKTVVDYLYTLIDFLQNEVPRLIHQDDTDLYNIRDEMLGEVKKTLYLFTLQ